MDRISRNPILKLMIIVVPIAVAYLMLVKSEDGSLVEKYPDQLTEKQATHPLAIIDEMELEKDGNADNLFREQGDDQEEEISSSARSFCSDNSRRMSAVIPDLRLCTPKYYSDCELCQEGSAFECIPALGLKKNLVGDAIGYPLGSIDSIEATEIVTQSLSQAGQGWRSAYIHAVAVEFTSFLKSRVERIEVEGQCIAKVEKCLPQEEILPLSNIEINAIHDSDTENGVDDLDYVNYCSNEYSWLINSANSDSNRATTEMLKPVFVKLQHNGYTAMIAKYIGLRDSRSSWRYLISKDGEPLHGLRIETPEYELRTEEEAKKYLMEIIDRLEASNVQE